MTIDLATINFIPSKGGGVIKSLSVTSNGVYSVPAGVDGYNPVDVDVHPSESLQRTYTSNGIYNIPGEWNGVEIEVNTPVPSGVMTITSNGTYDVTSFASASVDVPSPEFVTEPLNVTTNGIYTPGQGVDGFSTVTVDVPQSVTGYTQKELTEGLCITNLNNSASFVGRYAFAYNSCLTTVDLPMCETIMNSAFYSCSSLQTVSLSVCSIVGNQAFYACSSLQTVSFPACTTVGEQAFGECYSLQTVSLPACTAVANYAFYKCSSLQTVSLPACNAVRYQAFIYCTSLSTVNLPVCSYISNYAFLNCSSLSVVYIGTSIDTVCVLTTSNVFDGCDALTSIYVPTSLVESYKTATNWTGYSDKIVGI